MTIGSLINAKGLASHPFEGHWRETEHVLGEKRCGQQLLSAMDEAGWHSYEAEVTYTLKEAGPVAISLSHNGVTAYGHRLIEVGDTLKVGPGVLRSISCLGAHALLEETFSPDIALTDRQLMPDNWFPNPDGRPKS